MNHPSLDKRSPCIVGIGNPVRCDDSVGLLVARRVHELVCQERRPVATAEQHAWCLDLLDDLAGCGRALIVDSAITGDRAPGETAVFPAAELDAMRGGAFVNAHGFNLASLLDTGRNLGYDLPERIDVLAVEITDNLTFSERPTPAVACRIDEIAARALEMIESS
jgi:hydrogenase maturation protease